MLLVCDGDGVRDPCIGIELELEVDSVSCSGSDAVALDVSVLADGDAVLASNEVDKEAVAVESVEVLGP